MAYKIGSTVSPLSNVATRTISSGEGAQTTVTVASGLSASSECYLLFWRIKLNGTATSQFHLRFNGGSANHRCVQLMVANSDEYTTNDTGDIRICEIVYNASQDNFASGMMVITPHHTVEGVSFERSAVGIGKSTWTGSTYPSFYGSGGEFEDDSTDISSIDVNASQANAIGVGSQFWLCKLDFAA